MHGVKIAKFESFKLPLWNSLLATDTDNRQLPLTLTTGPESADVGSSQCQLSVVSGKGNAWRQNRQIRELQTSTLEFFTGN